MSIGPYHKVVFTPVSQLKQFGGFVLEGRVRLDGHLAVAVVVVVVGAGVVPSSSVAVLISSCRCNHIGKRGAGGDENG